MQTDSFRSGKRRMRLRTLVLSLALSLVAAISVTSLSAQSPQAPDASPVQAQSSSSANSQEHPAYSLPPEKLARAISYSRIRVILDFLGSGWGILQLALLLGLGAVAKMRNTAVNLSRNHWVQGFVFLFLLLAVTTLLDLPLDLYGHHAAV